jgi:hypothetical protein
MAALGAVLALAACQKQHPISVRVEPRFNKQEDGAFVVEKIAVFPFLTALHDSDDPGDEAPALMEQVFMEVLDARSDYRFVSPGTVRSAVEMAGLRERYETFMQTYPRSDEADPAFIAELARTLQCDAFLVPVVDMWQKDEADYRESASSATYVGATVTVLDGDAEPGAILFRAVDEDYLEGTRTETGDRTVVKSGGILRADEGEKLFKAPEFEDVANKVARSLVGSLPAR